MKVEMYSLRFELATSPPGLKFITIPLDGRTKWRPSELGKIWLDMEARNMIIVEARRWLVKHVWPLPDSLCKSGYPAVKSGWVWLDEVSQSDGKSAEE